MFYFLFTLYLQKKESMESMKQRRTIRKYQPKDIPADLLNDLLETSFRASTVGNMQVYSVIVTRDADRKAKLAPAHFNQPMVQTAPVVLTFCIDLNRFSKWCRQRNAEPGYDNFEWFVTGAVDALLVAQTFCVAAEEAGLGICYLGTTTYNPQMIIETLHLPELVFPITTVTVGWPEELPEQTDRLPLEALVHNEVYRDYTPDDINRLYAHKESLPQNRQFVQENNKQTLAQVFTDIRYTKKANEAMSENLWETMKKQGF
ncbi:NADPH-dependent oxidoreductase [Bacteroides zoogleoformans]|uniref:NADPH-dependent oxidoreductase n=2 Tax=Bacteroides zoogleoformans TaxID=28119 RepID=A0ABN5ILJ0_9BACE|nr:NADPH-dependent oxidoreductase [Bacteroides zoogleoformans]